MRLVSVFLLLMLLSITTQCASPPPRDEAAAFYNRGLAYETIGDDNRALQDYDQAIHLRPD